MLLPTIKLAVLGTLPRDFDIRDIAQWKSSAFVVDSNVESFQLNEDALGSDWEYLDSQLEKYIPHQVDGGFLVIFLNVPLQHNWYVRRLSKNRVLFTFHEMDQILLFHNIPLQNLALRVLYAGSLIYRRYGNRIPEASEKTNYAHDETRGCLFDMNPSKVDVIHSLHEPILCEYCIAKLKEAQVPNELIQTVRDEIKRIRKPLFYRISGFVTRNPLWSFGISLFTALGIGVLASVLAAYVYDYIKSAT